MNPASASSATIRCAARSVIPTICAMSRVRTSPSRAMQSSTCVWLVRNVQVRLSFDMYDLLFVYLKTR